MCQIFFIVVILFLKELQPIRNVGTFSFSSLAASSRVRAARGAAPALLVRQAAACAAAERAAARGTRAGR